MKRLQKLVELTGGRPLAVDPSRLERAYGDRKPYAVRDGVAVIDISGPLMKSPSLIDEWLGGATGYGQISTEVADAATDEAISAIVLLIDSPGGEVSGSFETAADIEAATQLKPVYAVADELAASAAYLLASSADKIYVAGKTGEVGAIGIIARHFDYSKMLAKAGIDVTTVFAGDRKNDFSPYEPLSKEALARLDAEVQRLYSEFVDWVADHRGIKTSAVRATEAGLFAAADAIKRGLADEIGTVRDALSALKSSAAASAAGINREEANYMADNTPKADATITAPDLDKIKADVIAEGFKNGFAEAAEIVALCAIAGKPTLALESITDRKMAKDVRAVLLEARAAEDEEEDISSQIKPGASGAKAQDGFDENALAERKRAQIEARKGGK